MNTIKKYFLAFLLLEMLFSYAPTYAQTTNSTPVYTGVSSQIEQFLCSPNSTASANPLFQCINKLYKFAIVLSSVIGVFFIVIAGYVYMSADGNNESVDKAKSILQTTITAIVILLVGYVLLKALNPDLVQYNNIQPPSVTLQLNAPPATGGGVISSPNQSTNAGTVPSNVSTAAQAILSNNKILVSSSCSDCPGNCANTTLQALAGGLQAPYDSPTSCGVGYVTVSASMLNGLLGIANNGQSFTISSMTSGHHSSVSDPHYQGLASDLVPNPINAAGQQSLIAGLQNNGASVVAIECVYNGSSVYWPVPAQAQANDTRCVGLSNYHIHAQWPN